MANHRINVILTDEEEAFIKWMANRYERRHDKNELQSEMKMMFYLQLRQDKDLYLEEYRCEHMNNLGQ